MTRGLTQHGPLQDLKQHTIIFVPHARAKFRKWRITTLQASIALGSLALVTLGGLAATVLFFDNSFDRQELESIRTENADLRAVNQRFETSVRELEDQLSDYQQRIHKLAIVAGLAELSPSGEPGIGGLGPATAPPRAQDGNAHRNLDQLQRQIGSLAINLDELDSSLNERFRMLSSVPSIVPVKGIFNSGFGYRKDPFTKKRAFHRGLDIVAPHGRDVVAPGSGIVTKAGRAGGYGKVVFVSHGYGLTTRYGHLSKISVEPGQRLKRGDVIGAVGNTGRSTGTHLHYEVRVDGKPVNPLSYVLDHGRK